MRVIHKVNINKSGHVSIQDQLFVGPNAYGPRGGCNGKVVDAVLVATGAICSKIRDLDISDEELMRIAQAEGPVTHTIWSKIQRRK